jgi:transaldolase
MEQGSRHRGTMNPLQRLGTLGQSVWYDNIRRGLLVTRGLERLIEDYAVVGVTSNPTIFHKAISETTEYDVAIADLRAGGASTPEILDALTTQDIAMAADQLRPIFTRSNGLDGWVSIEVPPGFAHRAAATVTEVHRLRSLVSRPNVFVKVPATAEGVVALRELIGQGVSINVTLTFGLERYGEVMEAYISGLENLSSRSVARGAPEPALGSVRSVASFFVSRVDTLVDSRLDALVATAREDGDDNRASYLEGLRGKAAVANAKLAYQRFLTTFAGPRWEALAARGAHVQRPLWASTSTKNPVYRDVMYVEDLIGPHTVNTMPQATLDAFREHGVVEPTLTQGIEVARAHLAELEASGVSMAEVAAQLEDDGVKAFAASWDALVVDLDKKR